MAYKKQNYIEEQSLKKSAYLEFDDKEKIKDRSNVHVSIKEKQMRIAELLSSKKNDNFPKKSVDFTLSQKTESEYMDECLARRKQFSVTNADIANKLNNTLFSKITTSKNVSFSNSKNSSYMDEKSLLDKNEKSFKNKSISSLNNKISEDYKNKLSSVLLSRDKSHFLKNKDFEKKNSNDFPKTDYIAEDNSNNSHKNSKGDIDNKRKDLFKQLLSTYSNLQKIDHNQNRDKNTLQKLENEDENKNESITDKNLYLNENFSNYKNNQNTMDPPNIIKKKKIINFFSCFKNLKRKKYYKRKNNMKCNSPIKEKHLSKTEEKIDITCYEEENSISSNKRARSKFFFFLK
ncbi:conserved Plasmodium protein, unknown function [Plasmodium gallinaceum]|uniref:Uncharacterized protein n=1 Tax=Plasmodium gallinaceum TaxID=5849 RepID=A0A1J1GL92_PLAGA|nr:conserved Plasmodium protein, unknown function [Plasmodium gallinaceum]CRG93174.1 conserved Plasmodium protein, unknown function [Plasmodium gallinaceum]